MLTFRNSEGNYWSNEDSWGDITGVLNQILLPSRFSSSLFENGEDAEVQRTAIGLVCTDPAETENADSEGKSTCAICYDSLHRTDRPTNFARLWESCNLIVLAMNIGSCQDEASFIDFPRPAGTWCEENKGICMFIIVSVVTLFELMLFHSALATNTLIVKTLKRRQRFALLLYLWIARINRNFLPGALLLPGLTFTLQDRRQQ